MSATTVRARIRERRHDPIFWTEVIQVVKTVVAAVLAWVVATDVLDLAQSFLAPWAALLVVHATVYRTFSQGARQVGATVVGVFLAWLVGTWFGVDPLAVATVLLAGLAVGAVPWLASEATTVAATGLVVLTTGSADQDNVLLSRLADTAVGVLVGLAVTFAVWPPLRRRAAEVAVEDLDDRLGALLVDIADGLALGVEPEDVDAWVARTRALDEDVDRAWSLVRQARESARMNPRRGASRMRDPKQWISLLQRVEQALADTGSMARTVRTGLADQEVWLPGFRDRFVEVLRATGRGVAGSDAEVLRQCRDDLDELVGLVEQEGTTARLWPVYGGLVINLRNILVSMEEVARFPPGGPPPSPLPPG